MHLTKLQNCRFQSLVQEIYPDSDKKASSNASTQRLSRFRSVSPVYNLRVLKIDGRRGRLRQMSSPLEYRFLLILVRLIQVVHLRTPILILTPGLFESNA